MSVINLTAGDDNFTNNNSNVVVNALRGNDTVSNNGENVTITGGAGNDSIENEGWYAKISGGSGNDSLDNLEGSDEVTIYGGAGNDVIYNDASEVKIYGGSGNDIIDNYMTSETTIDGGKGNDTISNNYHIKEGRDVADNSGSEVLFNYALGDGNDIIYGFRNDSTLSIAGSSYSTQESGENIIVTVGKGKISLMGAASLSAVNIVTVSGGNIDDTIPSGDDTVVAGISVTGGVVTATNKFTGSKIDLADYSSATKVNAAAVTKNISIVGNAKANTLRGGSGNDTLTGGKGADSIYGSAGNDLIYGGEGKDLLCGDSGNDTLSGGNDNDRLWGGTGNDELWGGNGADTLSGENGNDKLNGDAGNDVLGGGEGADTLSGGNGNDELWGDSDNDILDGGDGNDLMVGGSGKDLFIFGTGNDTITDYVSGTDKISVSGSYTGKILGNNVILTTDSGTLKILNAANKNITINGVTKKFSSGGSLSTGLSYNADKTVLVVGNNFTGSKIDLSKYAGVFDVDAHKCTRTNLNIIGNKLNNSLVGGKGSDTIAGGAGNDTLKGGAGNDIFVYSASDDVITDYRVSADKIKLKNTKITDIKTGEENIILTTSTGTLKILNGAGKSITIIDSSGKETTQRYAANISEIIADDSVGKFENYTEKVTQENLITFAK